jgi:hypothetical protein
VLKVHESPLGVIAEKKTKEGNENSIFCALMHGVRRKKPELNTKSFCCPHDRVQGTGFLRVLTTKGDVLKDLEHLAWVLHRRKTRFDVTEQGSLGVRD